MRCRFFLRRKCTRDAFHILKGMAVAPNPAVASAQDRYSRQILFSGIGEQGQQELFAAHVAIVGCGATGAAVAGLLARAGLAH